MPLRCWLNTCREVGASWNMLPGLCADGRLNSLWRMRIRCRWHWPNGVASWPEALALLVGVPGARGATRPATGGAEEGMEEREEEVVEEEEE